MKKFPLMSLASNQLPEVNFRYENTSICNDVVINSYTTLNTTSKFITKEGHSKPCIELHLQNNVDRNLYHYNCAVA